MIADRRAVALLAAILFLIALLYVPSVVKSFTDWGGWALSDLHINYADGLVRRGFLGEIAYRLRLRGIDTREFFGIVFLVMTAIEAGLMAVLAWPLARRWPVVFIAVMLSPILLLFAAYDYGAYLRRDVFISVGLLYHALIVREVRRGSLPEARYGFFTLCILSPYLMLVCAMHELQTFFLTVHMGLAWLALGSFRRAIRPLAAFAIVGGVAVLFAIVFRGDGETAQRVCQSWIGLAGIRCWGIETLGYGWAELWAWNERILNKPISVAIFAAAALLAALPVLAIREAITRDGWELLPARLVAFAILPLLTIFILGWDWGRWIRFIALSVIALLLSAPAKQPATSLASSLNGGLALVGALAYLSTWKVRHCCEIASLDGGFFVTLFSALDLIFD